MAYSGTTTFNLTAQQICNRAAAKLEVIDTQNGEALTAQQYNDFLQQLNLISKRTMATKGVLPWTRDYFTLVLQQGQVNYDLGLTGDNFTLASSLVTTTLTANAAQGATSITVASIAGLNSGMNIGIKLTSGLTFWTTINGAPAGSTVTLTSGLSGAAASGNYIYAYTTKGDRPQKVLECTRVNTSGQSIPLDAISLQEYAQLPDKATTGIPLQRHFSNKIPNAQLTIWQPYDGTSGWDTLSLLCDTIVQDVTNTTDNAYFPVEWVDYLVFQTAYEMSFEFNFVPIEKRQELRALANSFLDDLMDYSSQLSETSLRMGLRFKNQ